MKQKNAILERQNSQLVNIIASGTSLKVTIVFFSKRPELENVYFIPFPRPHVNKENYLRWIKACNRQHDQFNITKIKDFHCVCSLQFEGGFGPTGSTSIFHEFAAIHFEMRSFFLRFVIETPLSLKNLCNSLTDFFIKISSMM